MYILIETKTEQFFLETSGCTLQPVTPPPQEGEPERLKTKTLIVHDAVGNTRLCYDLEPGDWIYMMNDAGRTINKIGI